MKVANRAQLEVSKISDSQNLLQIRLEAPDKFGLIYKWFLRLQSVNVITEKNSLIDVLLQMIKLFLQATKNLFAFYM